MTALKIFLIIEILIIGAVSWKRNSDIFSPVKIYLLFSVFFYLAIFFREVRWETLLCYVALIQLIALNIFIEKKKSADVISPPPKSVKRLAKVVWMLSLPSIATIVYFIWEAGGIIQYLGVVAIRVFAWKGKGYFVILLNILPTLNLLYFANILMIKERTIADLIGYGLHFVAFVIIGLLTGSRSYIGISLLGMYMVWCYVIKVPKIRYAIMFSGALVILVGLLGTARNNYGGEINSDFWNNVFQVKNIETAQMAYGSTPLEIIFGSTKTPFLGGMTYLTVITNFIPRAIYPNKPDTGGIVFTKIFTDDQWGGFSNLATGAITEGILNFGIIFGIIFGLMLNATVFVIGCVVYNKTISRPSQNEEALRITSVIAYFYIILACARFSYGEFTDIIQSLFLFNLIPLWLVRFGAQLKFK